MPAPVLHLGATVLCGHGGQANVLTAFPRVTVGGQPVVTLSSVYAIAGCGLTGTPNPPCATAQFTVGAMRVKAGGAPVATKAGSATCVPTGSPLTAAGQQTKVMAT